jgi:hypothetical protein
MAKRGGRPPVAAAKKQPRQETRIAINAAFEMLLAAHPPHRARALLSDALLGNDVRLYRDGTLVTPAGMLDDGLYVRVEFEADGRCVCSMGGYLPPGPHPVLSVDEDDEGRRWVTTILPPEPAWEVVASEIKALIPRQKKRYPPGPRPRDNWKEKLAQELHRMGRKSVQNLENSGALVGKLRDWGTAKKIRLPVEDKRIRPIIKAFLAGRI